MDATGSVLSAATSAAADGGSASTVQSGTLQSGTLQSGTLQSGTLQSGTIQAGYDSSLSGDIAAFEGSLQAAAQTQNESAMKAVLEPLDYIDNEANNLIDYAETAVKSGNELTPSEIVMLTAKSQEFMFHSQLTANVANRTADGLSQLFRQQS